MMRLLTVILFAVPLPAQWLNYKTPGIPRTRDGKLDFSAPTPRTSDGKPDLSGLWEPGTGGSLAPVAGATPVDPQFRDIGLNIKGGLPYQPWAAALVRRRQEENIKDDPDSRCMPLGLVKMHLHPYPRKILQVPGLVVILFERDTAYRQIFTDGRPLPGDPQPSFNGYSTGHWDGDTLVVETVGFRDDLWLDVNGNPLTSAAKVTERFHRPIFGRLEVEVTVNDPKAYTKPWTIQVNQTTAPDTEMLEFVCENERDVPHLVGK
jgi:hypothetical protein